MFLYNVYYNVSYLYISENVNKNKRSCPGISNYAWYFIKKEDGCLRGL